MPPPRRITRNIIPPMKRAAELLPGTIITSVTTKGRFMYIHLLTFSLRGFFSSPFLRASIAQARYMTMATLTTSNTWIWNPAIWRIRRAPFSSMERTTGVSILDISSAKSRNESGKPHFDSHRKNLIFFML